MTILPKKKQNKDKSSENDNSDGPQSPPVSEQGSGRSSLARARPGSPGPQRWASPPPIDHDRGGHETSSRFEESGTSHSSVGANKRRIRDRSSPHRTVRKQRHELNAVGRVASNVQLQVASPGGVMTSSSSSARTSGLRNCGQPISSPNDSRLVPSTSHLVPSTSEEARAEKYNSDDENDRPYDASQEEKEFEMMLKEKRGFIIKRMGDDGACMFRAVADQVYGDEEMHSVVRFNCVEYMAKNADFFKQFVTEDFPEYLNRKRLDACHGNHVEMQALCELYNRPIEVYQMSLDPINTFHATYETDNEPIRLSYHGNVHYNSVVDPYKATIGVGLGLPGLQPGQADRNLLRDAVRQSEDIHIEQTMLEDKLRETDWELTQETIEEQVARESYLQWLKDQEKSAKSKTSPRSATCSSATDNQHHHIWWEPSVNASSSHDVPPSKVTTRGKTSEQGSPKLEVCGQPSPKSPLYQCTSSTTAASVGQKVKSPSPKSSQDVGGAVGGAMEFQETASLMNELPPQFFGLSDWDDDTGMLARAIVESQQHYLNELKMAAQQGGGSSAAPPSPASRSSSSKGKSLMPKDNNKPT